MEDMERTVIAWSQVTFNVSTVTDALDIAIIAELRWYGSLCNVFVSFKLGHVCVVTVAKCNEKQTHHHVVRVTDKWKWCNLIFSFLNLVWKLPLQKNRQFLYFHWQWHSLLQHGAPFCLTAGKCFSKPEVLKSCVKDPQINKLLALAPPSKNIL